MSPFSHYPPGDDLSAFVLVFLSIAMLYFLWKIFEILLHILVHVLL